MDIFSISTSDKQQNFKIIIELTYNRSYKQTNNALSALSIKLKATRARN